jgi:hypothetical protein
MATSILTQTEQGRNPVEAQARPYDGRSIVALHSDTRELYATLTMAGARLADRYNAGGTADTISAWVTYMLQEFEVRLNDPLKSEKYLKDLKHDIEARLADGRW